MNPLYQEALNGTLRSTGDGALVSSPVTFENLMRVPVLISVADSDGTHQLQNRLGPGDTIEYQHLRTTTYLVVQNAASGSFMYVVQPAPNQSHYDITSEYLTFPSDIGAFPEPSREMLVPPNPALVMVGTGLAPNGNIVVREQGWMRQADSFSLAAGETKTSSLTVTRGLQQTSSSTETVGGALGVSGGAGWGPISASVSASLNASATFFQQVTVSEQTSVYESKTFTNKEASAVMYLVWQLSDVITIYDTATAQPIASMSFGEPPSIISGPHFPDQLASAENVMVEASEGFVLPTVAPKA